MQRICPGFQDLTKQKYKGSARVLMILQSKIYKGYAKVTIIYNVYLGGSLKSCFKGFQNPLSIVLRDAIMF